MNSRLLAAALALPALASVSPSARAFVVNISGALSPQVYLCVGACVYSGRFTQGGTPGTGGARNMVSVAVPAASLGNGSALAMTSDSTQAISPYDNYAFCNPPNEIYVGGFNRSGLFSGGNGTLTVTAPTSLTNASGDTIPFSQIGWTSSGNGDTGGQPFPAGSFTGGTQTLANFPVNTWRESCHSFRYANSNVVAAGTFNGSVIYTLSVP